MKRRNISYLIGKTLTKIQNNDDEIVFFTDTEEFVMYHNQDCCEYVRVEDICGDLDDLVGSPIIVAEERTNRTDKPEKEYVDSFTWTFYTLATKNGYVDIRWLGESNGYYSESVDFEQVILDGQIDVDDTDAVRLINQEQVDFICNHFNLPYETPSQEEFDEGVVFNTYHRCIMSLEYFSRGEIVEFDSVIF